MKDVMQCLSPIAERWKILAINLELEKGVINAIEVDHKLAEDRLIGVINKWDEIVGLENTTWETLRLAVTNISEHVAEKIRIKYLL